MRDRALSLALAVLAILLFAGIFLEPKPQLSNSMASTIDQGEQGFAAFFQWLKARKVPVESWRERWFELDQRYQAGHVFVTSVPFRMQDEKTGAWADAPKAYVDAREKAAMVEWIAAGNTLVLTVGALDAEGNTREARQNARRELGYFDFLKKLGWTLSGTATEETEATAEVDRDEVSSAEDAEVESAKKVLSDDSDKSSKAREVEKLEAEIAVANARPQALHQLELQFSPNQLAHKFEHIAWEPQGARTLALTPIASVEECSAGENAELGESDQSDSNIDSKTSAAVDYSKDEIADDGSVTNSGGSSSRLSGPAFESATQPNICRPHGVQQALVLLRSTRDQSPAGWWLPFGQGGVVVLGYGSLWKNPNLAREGNALAGESLLTRFLKPGGVVLFDDYRYGLSSIYDPDALLADPRLYKTLGVVAVLWLLYAVGRSRRMLPVRVPEPRPSSATFARAISDFYARSLSAPEMAEALGTHFLNSARRAYGINGSDDAVWARLKREGVLDSADLSAAQHLSFSRDAGRNNVQLTTLIVALERRFRRVK